MALYLEHFGLGEPPFRITPHADFFYDGADRGATLDGLLYAILHDEGIVKVSGEIGSGKTTLCRVLMERLPPEVETVFLANPSYSRHEILFAISEDLGRTGPVNPAAPALHDLQARLIELYAAGRRVVVMIDEAHAMPEETLEQVRLLSNLETGRHKLLQIVLFGQPELDETLAKPSMRQLKDRITHHFRTRPLSAAEIGTYVSFRMRAAGYRGPEIFSAGAIAAVTRASSGLTRRINVLCDKALLAAFAAGTHAVTPREVRSAVADSSFSPVDGRRPLGQRAALAALLIALGGLIAAAVFAWVEKGGAPLTATKEPSQTAGAALPTVPAAPIAAVAAPSPPEIPTPEKASPPLLNPDQVRRLDRYVAGPHPLLRERLTATRIALSEEPDSSYTIQLFQSTNSDPARTERFLTRAQDLVPLEQVYVIPVANGSGFVLRVTFGVFDTKTEATSAAKRLPPRYQNAFKPEIRSIAEMRTLI
jgi:type II secretory pathway predicted ATPase ExeA